jgi:iron(III) transport system ATP-binding protein
MQLELRALQKSVGITFVFVTHDQEEALTMSDRVAVMSKGQVLQVEGPMGLYERPTTRFVADFIGTMNFVPGTIAGQNRLRLGGLELACASDDLTEGAPVTVAVRREDIVVWGQAGGGENAFSVRVCEMEFLGSFFRAELASEAMGEALLRADFSINAVRREGISEGKELTVTVPSERIRVFPGGTMNG